MISLAKNGFFRFLTSYTLTVIILLLLIVLTFWGTLYQVDYGLYVTKQRFFNSWFLLAGGFLPFPGGRLVMWAGFINLLAVTLFRLSYRWSKMGIILTHVGLLILLVSSSVTLHFAQAFYDAHSSGGQTINYLSIMHDCPEAIQ